ncbi:hypothetical protein HYPSUDRAFT_209528 [Hypholoma sublateritium FD-334 SS-4]|uniref:Uncharacterized protein n=1 Tax=Hypholoma sublateritium (strain FD-334 SS-4) TaxID=945553 RepID=A0A0D2LRK4_HYPSF|nr:hypothetical protein HYPSUDRAFT_209528 [Hypholoma sublateritium FD-334 SS-4]
MQTRPQKKAKKKKTHTFVVLLHRPRHAPTEHLPAQERALLHRRRRDHRLLLTLILAEHLIPTTRMPVGRCLLDHVLVFPFFPSHSSALRAVARSAPKRWCTVFKFSSHLILSDARSRSAHVYSPHSSTRSNYSALIVLNGQSELLEPVVNTSEPRIVDHCSPAMRCTHLTPAPVLSVFALLVKPPALGHSGTPIAGMPTLTLPADDSEADEVVGSVRASSDGKRNVEVSPSLGMLRFFAPSLCAG